MTPPLLFLRHRAQDIREWFDGAWAEEMLSPAIPPLLGYSAGAELPATGRQTIPLSTDHSKQGRDCARQRSPNNFAPQNLAHQPCLLAEASPPRFVAETLADAQKRRSLFCAAGTGLAQSRPPRFVADGSKGGAG